MNYRDLCLKESPHKDFCVRGLPKAVTEEKFRTYVENLGVRVRFVRIHKLKEDDLRGTTFARVGTYESDAETMMDGSKWFKNISVRLWGYKPDLQEERKPSDL